MFSQNPLKIIETWKILRLDNPLMQSITKINPKAVVVIKVFSNLLAVSEILSYTVCFLSLFKKWTLTLKTVGD